MMRRLTVFDFSGDGHTGADGDLFAVNPERALVQCEGGGVVGDAFLSSVTASAPTAWMAGCCTATSTGAVSWVRFSRRVALRVSDWSFWLAMTLAANELITELCAPRG
jgi:hypothetical protein